MAGVFKAYDIRGIYGDTLTEPLARHIGRALVTLLGCRTVAIGQDMRPHSEPLAEALIDGITQQGADVVRVGLCSTPMCYHAVGHLRSDAGVMITASHNTGEWNGFKLTRAEAVPISSDTGIVEIEKIVAEESFAPAAETPGSVSEYDIASEYAAHVAEHANLARPVSVAIDHANGMGIVEARTLDDLLEITSLFDVLDGTFPNHEANPLKVETFEALQVKVRSEDFDFGAAFDGDADRVGFVDEKGEVIPMDMTTALIAQDTLQNEKGVVFYDLRSSWATKEVIEEAGGTAMMSRVGHSFIKKQMRDNNAIFAGELSGHYYFRSNYFTESSATAILSMANILSHSDEPLSELIRPIQRYHASGEINSEVGDSAAVLDAVRSAYTDGRTFELDGVSVEYDDWWFNVRCSNTEPLVRLNLEAKSAEQMEEKRDELLALIRSH
jgi:phosphomannomutase